MSSLEGLGTTYEIGQPPPAKRVFKRLEKWRLQAVARDVLPDDRVSNCMRAIIAKNGEVRVHQANERAHYGGLMTCGSVWVCPVCASKISERRRKELINGIEIWKKRGGQVAMLTLTVPHYEHQRLKQVLKGFSKARKLMRNRKPWKRMVKASGLVGSVRALEVTHGENGWHVHSHEILFFEPGADRDPAILESEILAMWKAACITAGLDEPNLHGVSVHDGSKAGDYASKWGMDHELTKGHIKVGRDGNLSPWDMLRRIDEGVSEYMGLFQEYAKAFKGKHQLVWSEGLRDLLGLGKEMTDEELAAKIEEEAVLLGSLTRFEWKQVLRAEKRGELLEIAVAAGWSGVLAFIRTLILPVPDCPF